MPEEPGIHQVRQILAEIACKTLASELMVLHIELDGDEGPYLRSANSFARVGRKAMESVLTFAESATRLSEPIRKKDHITTVLRFLQDAAEYLDKDFVSPLESVTNEVEAENLIVTLRKSTRDWRQQSEDNLTTAIGQRRHKSTNDDEDKMIETEKVIVVLDLSRYSDIARTYQQGLTVESVLQLNQAIEELVIRSIEIANREISDAELKFEDAILATTGDGAILGFEKADHAHAFAMHLHRESEQHNAKKEGLARRHFRIGIARGEIMLGHNDSGRIVMAGIAIADAVRLEAACTTGEILIQTDAWVKLSDTIRPMYGGEETVEGKRSEKIQAHRRKAVDAAPWDVNTESSA